MQDGGLLDFFMMLQFSANPSIEQIPAKILACIVELEFITDLHLGPFQRAYHSATNLLLFFFCFSFRSSGS